MSVIDELKRRNVFKVGAGYLLFAWLILQIASVIVPILELPSWTLKLLLFFGVLGFFLALFFAWAYELSPDGIKRESDLSPNEAHKEKTDKSLNLIILSLLIIVVGYLVYDNFLSTSKSDELSKAALSESTTQVDAKDQEEQVLDTVISLAVLPFVNMSNEPEQEYFVDGLTEELLNSLFRIDGLKLTGRTSSFEFKDKNIDLREIAKKLNVKYLVEGSVRKNGENIRITVQLIESESGTHLLSDTFDRKLIDVFALQEEISNQIAAALNLTLMLKDERYTSALSTLDYLAVEELVKARGILGQYTESASKEAYDIAFRLNEKFPDTPEILGLMAYAAMLHSSTGSLLISNDNNVELAKMALSSDRKNYDALRTLAGSYDDHANTYNEAEGIYNELIRYYPAAARPYTGMLYFLQGTLTDCRTIQRFLQSVPDGVFDSQTQQRYESDMEKCLSPVVVDETHSSDDGKSLTNTDGFERLQGLVKSNPNQRFLSSYHKVLLSNGAKQTAATIRKKIDLSTQSFWQMDVYMSLYMHDIEADILPFDLIPALEEIYRNGSHTDYAIALAKQAYDEGRQEELKAYIDKVPAFVLSTRTLPETTGLIVMQRYAGETELSRKNASKIFNILTEYKKSHPESYQYYGLNFDTFEYAFYSGNGQMAAKILAEDFPNDFPYWLLNEKELEFVFMPFKDSPTVIEFLKRINVSDELMRDKYGLQ
ncbi:MAG: TolB-like protein [Oleiphilaceae bacterium]|jgi:TolB-like protein